MPASNNPLPYNEEPFLANLHITTTQSTLLEARTVWVCVITTQSELVQRLLDTHPDENRHGKHGQTASPGTFYLLYFRWCQLVHSTLIVAMMA